MDITSTVQHRTSPDSDKMILLFLRNHPQGVLTTLTKNATPQSSVVTLYCIDDYRFVFMTKKQTRKNRNLQINPALSFLSYDVFSRTEVEIEGIAHIIDSVSQQDEVVEIIKREAEKGRWHISPYVTNKDNYILFAVYPKSIHMTTYWEHKTGTKVYDEAINFNVSMA